MTGSDLTKVTLAPSLSQRERESRWKAVVRFELLAKLD
jgi:hypothetical protein